MPTNDQKLYIILRKRGAFDDKIGDDENVALGCVIILVVVAVVVAVATLASWLLHFPKAFWN